MSLVGPIKTELPDLQRDLGRFADGADDRIAKMLTQAAETVADDAQRLVPRRSGDARASLRATTGAKPSVVFGGSGVRYAGWLEFGGRVGRHESVSRPFVPGGRYIWPTWMRDRQELLAMMERGLADEAAQAGL